MTHKNKKAQLEKVKESASICFNEWNLQTVENLNQLLGEAVYKAAAEAITLSSKHAEFARLDEKVSSDPTTIRIMVDLVNQDDNWLNPSWDLRLSDLVDDLIKNFIVDGKFEKEDIPTIMIIRDGLAAQLDKIDDVVKRSVKEPHK